MAHGVVVRVATCNTRTCTCQLRRPTCRHKSRFDNIRTTNNSVLRPLY